MKIAMISQPTNHLTDEEILAAKKRALKVLKNKGYIVLDTYFKDTYLYEDYLRRTKGVEQFSVAMLAHSIDVMSKCHVVYFCKGWENARDCRIEHEIAKQYGLKIIYEEGGDNHE